MNLLVLGGAGYIGSHFVKLATELKHNVIVVDNLLTGHKESVNKKAKFYKGDIRDRIFLDKVFKENNIDACIHFAASSLVGESMKNPVKYFDNNVTGTIILLEMMAKYDVKKIVFSSSAATYGQHDKMPITEDYETKPTNPYGETKLFMEKMMKWSDLAYGIKYVSLRYFNVAGASIDSSIGEDHRPETHLIPIVLQVPLEKREYITIFGDDYKTKDGTCIRDYIHVEDLVDAHIKALNYLAKGNNSEVFNLGTETGYSNKEIVETARTVTKHPVPMKLGNRRPGDPDKLVATYKKAEKILGWTPTKDIKAIISSAWNFHKKHPNGFEE
ncbi:UDP-glucose 4-epimerase GalE [Candidatus Izemoplasma sp. B36]|uniref:UDP-glucose 4-epimerase GalE n=1 Tax=Candidatus Izemoplasma sp. B36 TaxID=3242468 RepID=UPI003557A2A7